MKKKHRKSIKHFVKHSRFKKKTTPPKGTCILENVDAEDCPRCGFPMQTREHAYLTAKIHEQPFYFERWYYCINFDCQTKQVNDERYKVFREEPKPSEMPEVRRFERVQEQLGRYDRLPWDD